MSKDTFDLLLAPSGDVALVGGAAQMVSGAQRVAQQIKLHLGTFLGEWFLDTTFGTPWFEQVLGKGREEAGQVAAVRAEVASIPDVVEVGPVEIRTDVRARRMEISLPGVITSLGKAAPILVILDR